jgi:hypothetical protein
MVSRSEDGNGLLCAGFEEKEKEKSSVRRASKSFAAVFVLSHHVFILLGGPLLHLAFVQTVLKSTVRVFRTNISLVETTAVTDHCVLIFELTVIS